jgi:hypothetical protein
MEVPGSEVAVDSASGWSGSSAASGAVGSCWFGNGCFLPNVNQSAANQGNFPTNQMHYQQQPRYQVPPYYGVQQQQTTTDSRYNSYNINPNLTSPDVADWQQQHSLPQQQQQQQQPRQQQQQIMNPYIQKELQNNPYQSMPHPLTNNMDFHHGAIHDPQSFLHQQQQQNDTPNTNFMQRGDTHSHSNMAAYFDSGNNDQQQMLARNIIPNNYLHQQANNAWESAMCRPQPPQQQVPTMNGGNDTSAMLNGGQQHLENDGQQGWNEWYGVES